MSTNLVDGVKLIRLEAAQATGTTGHNTPTIDTRGYDGFLVVGSIGTPGAGNDVRIQDSDDDATYADVAASKNDLSVNATFYHDVYRPIKRYNQVKFTRGSTTTVDPTWAILYKGRKSAVAQAIAGKILASPDQGTA